MCDYQAEKLRIYEEHLTVLAGKERPELTESDKCRLVQKGEALNDFLLASIEPTWAPGTIRGWYNELVGAKYDSTKSPDQKKRGRKPISPEIVDVVLNLAQNNPDWGYEHIAGTMRYLGYDVSATTIRHILNDHGIVPDPERRLRGDWDQSIETQQYCTASTDFAQVERLTPYGTECLDKIIFTSEAQLRLAVKEYLEYWNHYRPMQGLGGKMVHPYPQDRNAPIKEVSFLGGLLHGYRREPVAA